jgi:hypothetical protein
MSRLRLADLPHAGGDQPLSESVPGQPGRYRRQLRLSLATGGAAESLEIDATPVLSVRFSERQLDARAADAAIPAKLATERGDLVLRLARAAVIARIEMAEREAGDALLAFRFDGEAVSDSPVRTASIYASGATLDVEAAALILRRRRHGAVQPLSPGDVTRIWLRAPPTLPRLSFAIALDPTGWQPLPPTAPADAEPFPTTADHGPALAAALTRALARWRDRDGLAVLPDPVAVDIAFEADAPCQAAVTALALDWRLGRASLPDGAEKLVLRLPAEPLAPVTAALRLPVASHFESPTVAFALARGGGRTVSAASTPTGPALPAASGEGRRVPAGWSLAARMTLAAPQMITALDLAAAGIEGPCTVRLRGWSDRDGAPGAPLFAAAPQTLAPGAPQPGRAVLEKPVVADAGLLWLGLEAVAGNCLVALSDSGEGVAEGDGAAWTLPRTLDGRGIIAVSVPPAAAAGAHMAGLRLRVSVGGIAVPLGGGPDVFTADLRPALVAPSPAAGPERLVTLVLSGPGPAVVTLRPPVVQYRL